ncbi:MAG: PEP-CTERM sorting domain-containing protein [Chromatiales bacterium]|jgi:hypothetical protein
MKLNKLTQALGICAALTATSAVMASPINPGEFFIKYNNWEVVQNDLDDFQDDPLGVLGSADTGNGSVDLKGIFHITSIAPDDSTAAYWNAGDDGKYLWGVFGGFDYLGQDGFGNLSYSGGFFEIYELPNTLDPYLDDPTVGVPDADVTKWIGDTGFTGITDVGTLLYSFNLDPNLPALGLGAPAGTTLSTSFTGLIGTGSFYASVGTTVNGTGIYNDEVDTDGKLGSDIFSKNSWEIASDLDGNGTNDGTTAPCEAGTSGPTCRTFGGGWDIISTDPVTGEAIPAPGVLALMGLGLVGLGFSSRRRKNS